MSYSGLQIIPKQMYRQRTTFLYKFIGNFTSELFITPLLYTSFRTHCSVHSYGVCHIIPPYLSYTLGAIPQDPSLFIDPYLERGERIEKDLEKRKQIKS